VLLGAFLMSCASGKTFPGRGFNGGANSGTIQNGNWAFTLSNASRNLYLGGNMTTASNAVTGTFVISGDPSTGFEFSPANPLVNMTGTLNGSTLTLTGTFSSSTITLNLTNLSTTGANTTMSGTYSVTGGTDTGDSGNVTAAVAGDFSGTWQGTDGTSGGTFNIVVAEGAAASGVFPLTVSSVTFSGGTGCSVALQSGQTATGFVAGGMFYVNVPVTDAGIAGTFGYFGIAPDPTNPASISGSYIYNQGTSCLFQNTDTTIPMTLTKQ
jgi:hypothetical protein